MEETSVEVQNSRIKKQNSKMYYITFTEQYKYFKNGFYKVEFSLKQIYTKFIAKSADLAQKIAADSAKGNYNNIVFYSMFKNI